MLLAFFVDTSRNTLYVSAAVCAAALTVPKPAEAVTFDLFLIADPTVSSTSETAPFSVELSSVYKLTINPASNTATGFIPFSDFSFDVETALSYENQTIPRAGGEPHDAGEPGEGTGDRFNSEAQTWDDVGILNDDEDDADKNIDFGRNSSVTFDVVSGGYTDLIIAEDGAFNPFDMYLCEDAACSISEKIFNGFSSILGDALEALDDFTRTDSTDADEIDQALLFRFSEPVTRYLKITEDDSRGPTGPYRNGQRLEVDFIGVGGTVPAVPVPAGLPLILTGLGAFAWMRRRRRA